MLALSPACCTPAHPPAKPAEPVAETPPPPPPHVARPILHAAWSFQAGPDACVARAKAGTTSLQVTVRPDGPVRLTLSVRGETPTRPAVRFSGPAGRWLIPGTHAGARAALFLLGRDETALSRILMLLSGGTLTLEPAAEDLPILSLPESGSEGQRWFACARRTVI